MTLSDILADVARRLNKAASLDSSTSTRLTAFVNQRHRELLTLPDCQQFRDDVTTFSTVADQSRYALPQAVARVHRMWQADDERKLTEQSMGWYRTAVPDPTVQTGDPEVFCVQGMTRVAKQPSNASQLWVKSTAAGDTQVLRIEGAITGGYQQIANVTLTGTTAVQIGTLATWEQVDNVYLATAAVGTVTLHEDSGTGTELARIALGATMPHYWTIHLWPTPSSAQTLTLDYAREVRDMSQNADEPLLPLDFHRMLVYGACMDECLKTDDPRYSIFEREWDKARSALLYWIHARASYRPGYASRGGSNLGATFPVGRW